MSTEYPEDLRYSESHEYLRVEGDMGTVGLSQYAVTELNELIFLELPEVGEAMTQGEPFGTVEAVKAVFDLNAPASGEVIEVNADVADNPQAVADDPHGAGWLIRIKMSDPAEADRLMDAASYTHHCESEAH